MAVSSHRRANRGAKSGANRRDAGPAAPARGAGRRDVWLGAALIIALAALAYIPALRAGFIWDDPDNIPQIPFQRTWTFLKWVWFKLGATQQYYPLTHSMFWVESRLFWLHPFGFHAVNLALHIAAALLLWRVLRHFGLRGAWLAAAVFAVHPVFVESVAWVTEGKNTLSTVFYLLAMNLAVSAWGLGGESGEPASEAKPRPFPWRPYATCMVCFVAAMLSKTATCTFPAALALVIWWKRGRLTRRDALPLLPMLALAIGAAKLTSGLERWNVGAIGLSELVFTPAQRVLIAGRALWFYAGKLVFPARLTFIYPRWHVDPHTAWQWTFPISASAVLLALWLARRRHGRGPLASSLFFAGTLAPALGFATVYAMRFSFVADHFQYLAAIGLIALGAELLVRIRLNRRLRIIGAAVLLIALSALTFRRAMAFRDAPTLWRDTLAKNPACFLAMNNLGGDAAARGDARAALDWYARSLAVFPNQPEAHLFRGQVDAGQGKYDAAEREYVAAMAALPGDRRIVALVEHERARMLAARGELPRAAARYERFLALDPGSEEGRLEYASVLQNLNRPRDAMGQYQKALELNPDSVAARSGMAQMMFVRGFLPDAIQAMSEAVEIDPDNPTLCNNYGVMLMRAKRPSDAAAQFANAIANDPHFAEAYDGMGNALEAQGRFEQAREMYRKALFLKPALAAAREHLDHLRARRTGL